MDLNQCFAVLEIKPGSTFEESKAAHRLLIQVWHPDKFEHNEKLRAKATEKMKLINEAWGEVKSYYDSGAPSAESYPTFNTSTTIFI